MTAPAEPAGTPKASRSTLGVVTTVIVAVATAILIVGLAILPFLSPAWVAFEQDRAQAAAWTGYSTEQLRGATDEILHDLVLGPPDFEATVDGAAVLTERERQHMRDVRGVFGGFALLAIIAAVIVAFAAIKRRWRPIGLGAKGLAIGVVAGGIVAFLAFDTAFEVFHQLFFASGSYTFDPATDRLVQLFPFEFWSETTIVLGGVILVISVIVALVAGRLERGSARERASTTASVPAEATR